MLRPFSKRVATRGSILGAGQKIAVPRKRFGGRECCDFRRLADRHEFRKGDGGYLNARFAQSRNRIVECALHVRIDIVEHAIGRNCQSEPFQSNRGRQLARLIAEYGVENPTASDAQADRTDRVERTRQWKRARLFRGRQSPCG